MVRIKKDLELVLTKGNIIVKNNTAIICLSPNSGGMEIDSIKLAKKLSLDTNITLVAKEGKFIANQSADYVGFNNITLETINFKSSISLAIVLRMREIIRKYGIKNVIFFGASELKSLYFAFLGFDINLIVRHGTTKSRPKKDWFHRLIYSKVNYHVSICQHLQKNVEHIIPFGENSKSVLIYPSLEPKEIKTIPHAKLALLHVGRIARGKGQCDALEACRVLYENNIDFVFYIVGGFEEKYKDEFMNFYETLEYKDKIELVGFTKDVESYFAKSDIFLFPSHGEGFGNAFLEALASELLCICYKNTSFPVLKELGFQFEMANDKDVDDLKKKLLHTAEKLEEKKQDRGENIRIVQKYFLQEDEINKYLEVLI